MHILNMQNTVKVTVISERAKNGTLRLAAQPRKAIVSALLGLSTCAVDMKTLDTKAPRTVNPRNVL